MEWGYSYGHLNENHILSKPTKRPLPWLTNTLFTILSVANVLKFVLKHLLYQAFTWYILLE